MERGKQTRGRQKIEMKLIENEEDRLITFSKRRSGIYKKASELATLCGADVGVVVFSPSGRPFSFASPSMEHIANRFLSRNPLQDADETHHLMEAHRRRRVEELNRQYNQLQAQLEAEKAKGKELRMLAKATDKDHRGWWEAPVQELDIDCLKQMNESLAELHLGVTAHISQRKKSNTTSTCTTSTAFGASSSAQPQLPINDSTSTRTHYNPSANFWGFNN